MLNWNVPLRLASGQVGRARRLLAVVIVAQGTAFPYEIKFRAVKINID